MSDDEAMRTNDRNLPDLPAMNKELFRHSINSFLTVLPRNGVMRHTKDDSACTSEPSSTSLFKAFVSTLHFSDALSLVELLFPKST